MTPWAGPGGVRERLRGTRRADVAIVGAGLTGLSAAVELLELDPDRRVVVLDAGHVAAGASGRGTGLLGTRVGPALVAARKKHGDDTARAAYLWSVGAVRDAIDLVARHGIDCDLVEGSQLVVAAGERAAAGQEREAAAARSLGLPIEHVTTLTGVAARYTSGLRYSPGATLDPAALTHGLAGLAEKRGATVYEHSRVRAVRGGLLNTVVTDLGEVHADNVIIAANAYGGAPGVIGVTVQAGVTEKLDPAALSALAGLRTEPLIEAGELSPYYRLTEDDRLVVGGGAVRRGFWSAEATEPDRVTAAVRALAPELADTRVESTWAGPVGMTLDGLPVVGRHPRDPGVYHAGGCNGHGLAVSLRNGATVARWIVGAEPEPLPWVRSRAPRLPGGRLVDLVLDRYLAHLTASTHIGRNQHGHP